MNFKFIPFLLVIIFSQIANCESKSSDDEESKRATLGFILNSAGSNTIVCSDPAPAFSTLATAGASSSCGRSGCHDVARSNNGQLNISDRTSVLTKVTAGSPNASLLFQVVNGGIMQQYSNFQIKSAIYCWIQGGANP